MTPSEELDVVLGEVKRLGVTIGRRKEPQVRAGQEKVIVKAVAFAWTKTHRSNLVGSLSPDILVGLDGKFAQMLACAQKDSSRNKIREIVRDLMENLISSQSSVVQAVGPRLIEPPDFSRLVSDGSMQEILRHRWRETEACLSGGAPLAATVMMGGILEGLLLARINRALESEKRMVFKCTSAPCDTKTGKVVPLQEWTLRHFIDVAHEMEWIGEGARQVGVVVRDYRNYIHPYKEKSHGIRVTLSDARLFWRVVDGLARELLR